MTSRTGLLAVAALSAGLLAGCGAPAQGSGDPAPAATSASPGGEGGSTAAVRAPESAPDDRAARAFEAFAAGGDGSRVPWARSVTIQVGDAVVREATPRQAARRASWEGCPADEATYEGRDCPVGLLQPLADLHRDGVAPVVEPGRPRTVGCSRVPASQLPETSTSLALRPPPQRRDCFSDFAVLLQVNDAGRVAGVALALSGP